MDDRQTIADSKRAFHKAFPHVIPPMYRRVADELLVELNLLAHQKEFVPNAFFAVFLTQVFDSFTIGYQPNKHVNGLFKALCVSNGFDPITLREKSDKVREIVGKYKFNDWDWSI